MISEMILQQAAQAQQERLLMIRRAWDAYHGQLPKPLRIQPGNPDDNVNLNFARTIVDDGVSALFGEDVEFEVANDESNDETMSAGNRIQSPEDQWLQNFWKQNRKMTLLGDAALNGGVCGHTFLRVHDPNPGRGQKLPRLIVLDPSTVTPVWHPDDYQDVLYYVIQWNAVDPYDRRPMARRQVIERAESEESWLITDQVSYGDSRVWQQISEPEVWPFDWSPIFHCQNLPAPNEFWGASDLECDIVDVLKAINFSMSNTSRILRYHAHPRTWGSGFAARDLGSDINGTIILPNKDAKLQNLEMTNDLSSSIEYYKRLKEALHEISQHPEVATGKVDQAGALSGVALQILYRPLIMKTSKKRRRYGDMLGDLCARMLEWGGYGDSENFDIELHWPNILPEDVKEEAEAGTLLEELGVSTDTVLQRLGFDPDLEREKKAKEKQTAADLGSALLAQFDRGQVPGQAPPPQQPAARNAGAAAAEEPA